MRTGTHTITPSTFPSGLDIVITLKYLLSQNIQDWPMWAAACRRMTLYQPYTIQSTYAIANRSTSLVQLPRPFHTHSSNKNLKNAPAINTPSWLLSTRPTASSSISSSKMPASCLATKISLTIFPVNSG